MRDYSERDEGKRVWLSEREIQLLLDNTPSDKSNQRVAIILAARCGLRRKEIVDVTPNDLVSTDTGQTVRIWEGKGEKYREVPAPQDLMNIALGMGNDPDEPFVDVDPSTVYTWVSRAAERAHAETGDAGWLEVGPHDLRRSWGVRLLESGVLPSVVMEWGGWEDWETFRNHYLAEFSPEALRRERTKVSWLAESRGGAEGQSEAINYAAVSSNSHNY
jgi:integrase